MLLDGKVALVSGTGPNIGSEVARTLAANGAVIACMDVNEEYAQATATSIHEAGGKAISVVANITKPESIERAMRVILEAYGGVHLLVNNAAISDHKPFLEADLSEWQKVLNVILTGTFIVSQQVARQMVLQSDGGAIVNIISTSGHRGETSRIAYGTAKSGLLNFTRSIAMQLAPHKIRVNSVSPTTTGTPVGRPDSPRDDNNPPGGVPLSRWGRTTDQAQAVLFLLSPNADFITGVDLPCDGGRMARF
jgi:NAD(P)-dependent dehydrogenase (short-subunit alcohol dehydrogenase family)